MQHNEAAPLPLAESELLAARTTETLADHSWCVVRMRLAADGEAERSVHVHAGAHHRAYQHERIVLPPDIVESIVTAMRAAFREREPIPESIDDSQALYRRVVFRDGGAPPKVVTVEYRSGYPVGPASAFEAAWRLFASEFPNTGRGHGVVPELEW
jgi:hypothetical protein